MPGQPAAGDHRGRRPALSLAPLKGQIVYRQVLAVVADRLWTPATRPGRWSDFPANTALSDFGASVATVSVETYDVPQRIGRLLRDAGVQGALVPAAINRERSTRVPAGS